MPYMNDSRKIKVSKELFLTLLDVGSLTYDDLKYKHNSTIFENRDHGSAIMIYQEVYATIWIGVNNVSLMVNKEEIKSFRFLI